MIIPEGEDFVGVDFTAEALQHAPAAEFADMVGDFLIPQESDGVLWRVWWDAASKTFAHEQLAKVGQWEHVTFAPIGRPTSAAASRVESLFGLVALRPAEDD